MDFHFRVDVYHHLPAEEEILSRLQQLKIQGETIMGQLAQDFEALRVAMNDATNTVAARIDRLTAGIKNSMTDEEVAALKAGFQAESDRLNTLGQDPVNPVP